MKTKQEFIKYQMNAVIGPSIYIGQAKWKTKKE